MAAMLEFKTKKKTAAQLKRADEREVYFSIDGVEYTGLKYPAPAIATKYLIDSSTVGYLTAAGSLMLAILGPESLNALLGWAGYGSEEFRSVLGLVAAKALGALEDPKV